MKKAKLLTINLILIFALPLLMSTYVSSVPITIVPQKRSTFNPFVATDLSSDSNYNKIHDR